MLYRLYNAEDFAALYAIEEVCFQAPFRFGRRYMRQLVNSSDAATWVAEKNGRMAGFAVVEWTGAVNDAVAYIQTIEVAPEQRGRGVGGELLRRIEGSAKAEGAQTIWLHVDAENGDAIRLYEAHGYRCDGQKDGYYPHGRPALVYGKPLETKQTD